MKRPVLTPAITPESLAKACGVSVLDLEQAPGNIYERLSATYSALWDIYNKLPTTFTPADFVRGCVDSALTEREHTVAMLAAVELVTLEG